MERRGGTSFAIFLVLNPILILIFQNCSVVPQKLVHAYSPNIPSRNVSSVLDSGSCRLVSEKICAE